MDEQLYRKRFDELIKQYSSGQIPFETLKQELRLLNMEEKANVA